jgi:hypothetical protein
MNRLWGVANGESAKTVERSATNIKLITPILSEILCLLKYLSKFIISKCSVTHQTVRLFGNVICGT